MTVEEALLKLYYRDKNMIVSIVQGKQQGVISDYIEPKLIIVESHDLFYLRMNKLVEKTNEIVSVFNDAFGKPIKNLCYFYKITEKGRKFVQNKILI